MERKTVALETLGCKLNQAESELMACHLAGAGYRLVDFSQPADVYLVNTCTVTHIADRKARRLLRWAHRQNPSSLVIASGCYAWRAPQEMVKSGADLVLKEGDGHHLLALLEQAAFLPAKPAREKASFDGKTRSQVIVQRGCQDFCTYCIVPLVRGKVHCSPPEDVLQEIERRVEEGYKEVVLTGTKIGSYRWGEVGLEDLIAQLLKDTKVERLRLSSLQPQEITAELINLLSHPRLCRHLHIPLQSGSDSVLERMGRLYSTAQFRQVVALLREAVPGIAITTDILVGFPGESDEEFEESCHFCQETGFARLHIFPYSPRPGTLAAQMPSQVEERVKRERCQRMLALAERSARRFQEGFLGESLPVLWEKEIAPGVWSGLTDNYIRVFTQSPEDLTNCLLTGRLVGMREEGVWVE